MESFHIGNFTFNLEKEFPGEVIRGKFPLRYGKGSEIRTPDYEFWFNLNGEIKFIRGLDIKKWPRPAEQLKRTDGNDWVYYSVGDTSSDKGIISWLGEYYMPCLPYPSNTIWESTYLSNPGTMNAFAAWSQLYGNIFGLQNKGLPAKAMEFIDLVLSNDEPVLYQRALQLNSIIGERISVLPPDSRHVDYELIPLMIADGCLYRCEFCCVKSGQHFRARSIDNIRSQIQQLQAFYGPNLENYHALFMGNHDALAAGEELILAAAHESIKAFGFETLSVTPRLYMFGSVDSLLRAGNAFFEKMNQMPFYTYINVGFESVDAPTLAYIQKPLDPLKVRQAFQKMLDINLNYTNIEVTGNFLLGEQLSPDHYQSLAGLLHDIPPQYKKGGIYLSPLMNSPKKRELLPKFYEIKNQSRLPAYIYLIQRL